MKSWLLTSQVIVMFCLLIFAVIRLQSQSALPMHGVTIPSSEQQVYDAYFYDYDIININTKEIFTLLHSQSHFESLFIQFNNKVYEFELEERDIRASHFRIYELNQYGRVEIPAGVNTTYSGETIANRFPVRITSDTNYFSLLMYTDKDVLVMERASNYYPQAAKGQYIVYWSGQMKTEGLEGTCPVKDIEKREHEYEHLDPQRGGGCKVVQIALANDYLMFQSYGSVTDVVNHNTTVLNNVYVNYDTEFSPNFNFELVEIVVVSESYSDPWTTSTNPNTLLNSFTSWGPSGFLQIHDVASLWTDRDLDGTTLGIAWIGAVCQNNRYNIVQDYTTNQNFLRVLQAHELGHNFNASHDSSSDYIMYPLVVNSNTWSTASITSINQYFMQSWSNCVSNCGVPTNDNCSGYRFLTVCPGNTCCGATEATIAGATQSIAGIACNGTSNLIRDVWFRFRASCNSHTITVVPSSGLDPVIDLRSGNCNGTNIACRNQGGGEGGTETLTYTNFTPGSLYYIRVYDHTTTGTPPSTNTFNICVTSPTCTNVEIISPPSNQTTCAGNTVTFDMSVSGSGPFSYYWYKGVNPNGVLVQSTLNTTSTNTSYTTPVLTASNNGDQYYCKVTNCCGLVVSYTSHVTLTVNSVPSQPSSIAGNTTPCLGSEQYSVTNVAGVDYTWSISGGGTLSGSGNTVMVDWTTPGAYTLSVTPTNICGDGTVTTLNVVVYVIPGNTEVSGGGLQCNTATLIASGGMGGTIYWQNTTSGGTDLSMPSSEQIVSESGVYYFRAHSVCGWGEEGSAEVTINTVINTNDSGEGSLRSMIDCVEDGGTIQFSLPGINQITLTSGEYVINKNMTIIGTGINNLILSGNNSSRLFHVTPGKLLNLKNMALINGNAAAPNGGAIFVEGSLTMENILFNNNFENGFTRKSITVVSPAGVVTVLGNVELEE